MTKSLAATRSTSRRSRKMTPWLPRTPVLTPLDADGRCGNCRGQVTSGGCPRCDSVRVYVIQAVPVPQYVQIIKTRWNW